MIFNLCEVVRTFIITYCTRIAKISLRLELYAGVHTIGQVCPVVSQLPPLGITLMTEYLFWRKKDNVHP